MNYSVCDIDLNNFKIGCGWPDYRNMTVSKITDEMFQNTPEEATDTRPQYYSRPGTSYVAPQQDNSAQRDALLMKKLYTELNKSLLPIVEEVLDMYEYVDSPIYDSEGIDRETIAQLVARIIEAANKEIDEIQEIILQEENPPETYSNNDMLDSLVQSLLLSEIFAVRRPRYRRAMSNYRFYNGRYDGIMPR